MKVLAVPLYVTMLELNEAVMELGWLVKKGAPVPTNFGVTFNLEALKATVLDH